MKFGIYTAIPWAKPHDLWPSAAEQEERCRALVKELGGEVVAVYRNDDDWGDYGSFFDPRGGWTTLRDALVGAEFDLLIFDRLQTVLAYWPDALALMTDSMQSCVRWRSVQEGDIDLYRAQQILGDMLGGEVA